MHNIHVHVHIMLSIVRYTYTYYTLYIHCVVYMKISTNHNSLGCKQPLGLDVKQSPNAQDAFRPMPGIFSYAGVTGSVDVLRHATYNKDDWPYRVVDVHDVHVHVYEGVHVQVHVHFGVTAKWGGIVVYLQQCLCTCIYMYM